MLMNLNIPICKVIKYYNNAAKIIDISGLTPSYKRWLKAEENILTRIVPEKATILEIGAGRGRIIDALNNGKREITGIEIANLSFLKNKYKNNRKIQILQMDAQNLLFKDNSFDICLMMYNTLGLMNNPIKVLKDCERVTCKNGKIIVSTYGIDKKYVLKERIKCFSKIGHKVKVKGLQLEINNGVTSHYFKEDELKKLFRETKLKPGYYSLTNLGCIWIAKK